MKKETFRLMGLALEHKTTNENGQSNKDCGSLWQKFEKDKIFNKIPGKISDEIYAVYHDYEGGHMDPFAYFIGCKVDASATVPQGLTSITIPEQEYTEFKAQGQMPNCIAETWQNIWNSNINRSYGFDFEIYDERSHDWENAEVPILISITA